MRFKTGSSDAYVDLSDRWPSGGFLSTAEELVRFGGAHLDDGFINPQTRQLIFTSQRTTAGNDTGTGFAWRIRNISNGLVYQHAGDQTGGRAFLLVNPATATSVALLTNLTFASFGQPEALALADLFV